MASSACPCHKGQGRADKVLGARLQLRERAVVPWTGLKPLEQLPRPSTVTMEHPSSDAIGAKQALIHLDEVVPAGTD